MRVSPHQKGTSTMMRQAWFTTLLIAGCAIEPSTGADLDSDATRTDSVASEVATRMGVDYSWARPSPQALIAAGYTFAVRYTSFNTTGKNLTASEASTLLAAGLDIVTNWENTAHDALGGFDEGARDAEASERQ